MAARRALIAHTASSLAIGIFLVVMPWLALEEDLGISVSALSLAAVWLSYLLAAPLAAVVVHRTPPLRVAGLGVVVMALASLAATALIGLGVQPFFSSLVAALVVGGCMPFLEGAVLTAINIPSHPELHLRRYALRTVLSRAGQLVGSAGGLFLLHLSGATVLLATNSLLLVLASLFVFHARVAGPSDRFSLRVEARSAFATLSSQKRLREIMVFHWCWAVLYGAGAVVLVAVLHDHLLLATEQASRVLLVSGLLVVFGTFHLTKRISARFGVAPTLAAMILIEGATLLPLIWVDLPLIGIGLVVGAQALALNVATVVLLAERGLAMPVGQEGFLQVFGQWISYFGFVVGTLLTAGFALFVPLVPLTATVALLLVLIALFLAWRPGPLAAVS